MNKSSDAKTRCGMVSIVGRPNVGKSTLLNTLLGEKIAIVSSVPQTTRAQIRGVYTDERGQIVFIDTPGLHLGRDKLDQFMNTSVSASLEQVDCIIYLVDTTRRIGEEEAYLAEKLKDVKIPIILGLNKVDLRSCDVQLYISHWENVKGVTVQEMDNFTLIALSGQDGKNKETLLDVIFGYLPQGPILYPADTVCDIPQKMVIADIIREKFLNIMRQEIPHALGVVVEQISPRKKGVLAIRALIFVERPHQKEIVIGKGGAILKRVGSEARVELEELLNTKIHLETFVKVQENWRDDPMFLKDLGFDESWIN